ncbi:MAG TPA: hypothetical protein EYP32_03340 [Aquificaceae bacterium]|nr:hypothetical protein [Aquificaceae bacterium]HIQ49331.1 hypothetical protein [Aquifex aeolicus]
MNVKRLKEVKDYEIPILEATVFDLFGGLPQAFIGISGEAGAGKSQTLMRLISDIAKKEPVLVILTEQSPHRWKAIFRKYDTNHENISVVFRSYVDSEFIREIGQRAERIIVMDSISGAVPETKARQVAKELRGLVEWKNKWLIGSLQVRKEGIAGGEGVEHMIEVEYEITYFQLKPQNKWLYEKLKPYGYEIGDYVRLIRNTFDKIRGVQNTNLVVIDIDKDTGLLEFRELGKKEIQVSE